MAITLNDNQFFTGLSNLALFIRVYATNTSTKVKSFVDNFATETLANGDTKLFPFADLPNVGDYSEESTLLRVTKNPVKEEDIKITEKKVISASYNQYILDMAFTNDSGMNMFIGYIIGLMESAKDSYIYNTIITDLFGREYTGTRLIEVDQLQISPQDTAEEINAKKLYNAKEIQLKIEDTINNMGVFSNKYNASGYKQALDVKDLRLIICNPYHNQQIIDLFAELLRSDYIENSYEKPEKIVIPSISIPSGQENVVGWIMHKNAYQWFYKFIVALAFFDSSNLNTNRFLHFWFGKGFLNTLPAVKIVVKNKV